jgi:hypothetical protein
MWAKLLTPLERSVANQFGIETSFSTVIDFLDLELDPILLGDSSLSLKNLTDPLSTALPTSVNVKGSGTAGLSLSRRMTRNTSEDGRQCPRSPHYSTQLSQNP